MVFKTRKKSIPYLASCYLVRHKVEGVDYVLKKIECDDENAARMAFKEAMALSELKHKSVCGYKEFFVTWDAKNSAMYVCIIMENYPKGDLSLWGQQSNAISSCTTIG